jgi:hypothetical protein
MAKRIIPTPRRNRVTGQGKGKQKRGFRLPVIIAIESIINNTPAIIRIYFDAVNIAISMLFSS